MQSKPDAPQSIALTGGPLDGAELMATAAELQEGRKVVRQTFNKPAAVYVRSGKVWEFGGLAEDRPEAIEAVLSFGGRLTDE